MRGALMWQNNGGSSRCYSKPVQTHCSKSQAIQASRRSGRLALDPAQLGQTCSLTRISIAWCRRRSVAGAHPLDSFPSNFFLPVKVLSRVFRGKFVAGLRRAFRSHQLRFYGEGVALPRRRTSLPFWARSFSRTGSSMPSHPLADGNMCCTIWPVTASSRRHL